MDDAILYLLHRSLSYLDRGCSTVRIMFFDYFSAINTIQPPFLKDKLTEMGVGSYLIKWVMGYLTVRSQYTQLKDCTSENVVSSIGAPQGTVLLPVLLTSDFKYNSTCVTCIKRGGLLNRMKMCTFFLFCLNIIFFSFSTALQKLQKILTCRPEDKISSVYPDC